MFNNIPEELRALPQWLVWRYKDVEGKKPTKIPYDAKTGKLASVTNRSTYSDFATAVSRAGDYSGIGFVFTDADPYVFIDLDDCRTLPNNEPNPNYETDLARQIKVYQEFDSYSEVSPSGVGLHVIIKGSIPSGRKRNFIEVYSSQRYATFTGNVYNNKPIVDQQEKLTQLWEQMEGKPTHAHTIIEQEQKYSDEEIIKQASEAANGHIFQPLLKGDWIGKYPSQSEADLTFINIIQFYTKNKEQIKRIYWNSLLGNTDKKRKRLDYVNGMINKAFDQTLPLVDIEGYTKNISDIKVKPQSVIQSVQSSIVPPPGLLGEIAHFIYQAAPRPVPEIALAAAIGLMAGICGRAYNISGTGLNQYVLVLAKTGSGKESAASGIDRLMNSIKSSVPTSINFRGPGIINSGQALAKYVGMTSHCFVSVLGEFGIRLETMSAQNATAAEKTLKMLLLDLYNKSGYGQTIQANIYSDKDQSVGVFESPAFSLLGESTPERFYSILNPTMITEGLLPRFTIIEYKGKRPEFNENHMNVQVPDELQKQLINLTSTVEEISHAKPRRIYPVEQSEEALKITRAFNKYADDRINNTDNDAVAELWNRAHMKVLKLSALVAVGVNYLKPIIIPEYVNWSINLITSDINALSAKFDAGEVGEKDTDESKQMKDMIKNIKEFLDSPWESVKGYCPSCEDLHKAKIIPYEYFTTKTSRLSSYRKDKNGATTALKKNIQSLIDIGKLEERTKDQNILNQFGIGRRVFTVNNRLFK